AGRAETYRRGGGNLSQVPATPAVSVCGDGARAPGGRVGGRGTSPGRTNAPGRGAGMRTGRGSCGPRAVGGWAGGRPACVTGRAPGPGVPAPRVPTPGAARACVPSAG